MLYETDEHVVCDDEDVIYDANTTLYSLVSTLAKVDLQSPFASDFDLFVDDNSDLLANAWVGWPVAGLASFCLRFPLVHHAVFRQQSSRRHCLRWP